MSKKYRAIFLPDDEDKKHYTKGGFFSVNEAEKYIFSLHCGTCKRYYPDNPENANCFDEWYIEEYEEDIKVK